MQINLLYAYFTVNMNLGYHLFLVRGRENVTWGGIRAGLGEGHGKWCKLHYCYDHSIKHSLLFSLS